MLEDVLGVLGELKNEKQTNNKKGTPLLMDIMLTKCFGISIMSAT